ncbi:MAG: hypothetical protein WC661_21290 [Opitutaceae bacterium]|jgi:hypothetical protein
MTKSKSHRTILAGVFIAAALLFVFALPLAVHADTVPAAVPASVVPTTDLPASVSPASDVPASAAVTQQTLPPGAVEIINALAAKFSWIPTVLSIYGMLAVGWQVLIAFAHNWAARSAGLLDDQWIAKLEALWWFRFFDRFFYFGGYFGSYMGGKKL